MNKGLNPHVKPGRQRQLSTLPMHSIPPTLLVPVDKGQPTHPISKPRIGQGRARLRRKFKTHQHIPLPIQTAAQPITTHVPKAALSLPEPIVQSQENVQPQHHILIPLPQHPPVDPTCIIQPIGPKIQHRPSPPYHDPYARPPPRPPEVTNLIDSRKDLLDNDLDRNVDVEENSPFQEGIISETYERPDTSYVQEPYELKDLIDTTKLIQKFLPKQMDIDKILDIIKRKVLKGMHLPLTIKEIQVGYLSSPYFKGLYLFLSQNKLPLSKLSMNLKVMSRSQKGHKFILCIIDKVTNYLITIPIHHSRSEEVGEVLIECVISKFFAPNCIIMDSIIMDQDSTFMSTLMNYLFWKLNIKIKTMAPYNHQSLQAEHGIKSLSRILTRHLTGQGQMWHKYLPLATFTHNMFNSPNLANHSPYELVFGRKPKLLLDLETDPNVKVSGRYREYFLQFSKRLEYLHKLLQDFWMKRLALMNKDRDDFQYNNRDLVYIISPLTSQLRTALRKVSIKYVGPLAIYKLVDPHNYLLITLDGKS